MLKPDYLLHISEGAEEIAEQLHSDIVKRIVKRIMVRIGRGDNYLLTAQDKWQIENLQQAGYLLEDIQKDIAKATKLQQTEIAEAMEDAGVKALDYDDKIYQSVGLSPTPLTQSPELIRLMQRNYEATMGEWSNFTQTTAEQAQRLFLSELDKAYNLVSTGALSYTAAVKEVINNIASNGVKVEWKRLDENGNPYVYHTDTIETATLRAVRTGVSQATGQITTARMKEMGACLAVTSSHMGARPSHAEWQGKVFYVDWQRMNEIYPLSEIPMPTNIDTSLAKKYPDFIESTRIGKVDGLEGANCRHSHSVFFQGMDNPFEQYDSEENRIQYEKEQYQRTLERRIRKTKREVMGLKEGVDSIKDDKAKFAADMDYQKKAALLAKQNAAYKEYCEKNNFRPLSDRIQIAKWDRQQAAAARGAAKRYENAHSGSVAKEKIIKTDIDDYLDYRKKYESNLSKLQRLEKENDELFDAFNMATDEKEGVRLEKIWESKYEELSKFEEIIKDLKANLLGKESKAVRQLEKELSDRTGIPIDKVKMSGMPYDCAKTVFDGYDKIIKLYPELRENLAGFEFTNDFSSGAYASCRILTGEIKGHSIFRNFNNLVKEYAEDVIKGYHPIGTDYRSVIVHELGHALDGYMTKKRLLDADFNQYGTIATSSKATKEMTLKMLGFDRQEIALKLKAQGLKTWERSDILDQREKEFIIQNVSEYAAENEREFFAECFAEYLMSDNPRKAAKIFGEIIDTALGR